MLKDIKNGAEIQACTKQPAIGSYIHKKEMVKIHGVMVCWFVGLFQNSGNSGTQKKRPQRVFTIVDKCLQSVSFGNLLAFQTAMICVSKFCNSVGPSKSSLLSH